MFPQAFRRFDHLPPAVRSFFPGCPDTTSVDVGPDDHRVTHDTGDTAAVGRWSTVVVRAVWSMLAQSIVPVSSFSLPMVKP